MRQWFDDLALGHIKLFSTELFCKKIHFLHNFLQNSFQKIFKILFLYIFFIFCKLKEIKSNSLVTVWNALGLSQQTTVSLNYSQSIKINIGPSDGGTIIPSSRRPIVHRIISKIVRFHEFSWKKNRCESLFMKCNRKIVS